MPKCLVQGHEAVDGTGHLVFGHAVLGVTGHIHDGVAQGERAARIIAQADGFGNLAIGDAGQEFHMGGIVQVDVSAQVVCLLHVLNGGDVGGEHDVRANGTDSLGHQQLRVAGAVAAAALFLQNLQNVGVGGSLYGEVLPEAGIPAERSLQSTGVGTDAGLIIDVERGGNFLNNFLGFCQGQKGSLLHNTSPRLHKI